MYTAYFGFTRKPFKPKDLKDFYRNVNFDTACADLLDGIREKRGFMLLTGEAGVGKTMVLRCCIEEAEDIRFVRLIKANLDFPDILNYLCSSLELPVEGLSVDEQRQRLLITLAAQARRNISIALLVDDAQHLSDDVFLSLQELVQTPALPSHRLQVVLVGLPELLNRLNEPALHQLRDHIRVKCQLVPLSSPEIGLFIEHQLKLAGWKGEKLLEPAAVERIAHYSKGVPRAIAILCDTVLLFASLQDEREITPVLVDEAAQSCFLGEKSKPITKISAVIDGVPLSEEAAANDSSDFAFDLSDFEFSFDAEQQTLATQAVDSVVPLSERTFRSQRPPAPAKNLATKSSDHTADSVEKILNDAGLGSVWVGAESASADKVSPPSASSVSEASLESFTQLLDQLVDKLNRNTPRQQKALRYFFDRYLRLAQGAEAARTHEFQQQIARLTVTQQPVLVGLATAVKAWSEQEGVLCALLINPSWWLYREIRLRLRGADLIFVNDGRVPPLRLLDGRDAQVVFLNYRAAVAGLAQTVLWLELDLCDHRGQWTAYNSAFEIQLKFTKGAGEASAQETFSAMRHDRFWPESSTTMQADSAWLWSDAGSSHSSETRALNAGNLVCTFPLELEVDPARSSSLSYTTVQALGRGTQLTRALLLAADPSQAPARIELVSRPFIIMGRHSSTAGTGFGDFTLGFVPKYTRISRLHCVISALGDQFSLMPASQVGRTYTGRNGRKLERGQWELLESEDTVEICDLYHLKLVLAWDGKWEPTPTHWDARRPREKFGEYLLDLVEVLRQRDLQSGAEELRKTLRQRYLNLLRIQERVSQLNGVGNPGALLYARFEREDAARRQIIHFYVPRWVSIGSTMDDGLRIDAEGVKPHHAELLFRDGMYWIQNLAEPGAVRIGYHDLAANEVLALEAGDTLFIGDARFTFEAY